MCEVVLTEITNLKVMEKQTSQKEQEIQSFAGKR